MHQKGVSLWGGLEGVKSASSTGITKSRGAARAYPPPSFSKNENYVLKKKLGLSDARNYRQFQQKHQMNQMRGNS
jgi:hypothetical protein